MRAIWFEPSGTGPCIQHLSHSCSTIRQRDDGRRHNEYPCRESNMSETQGIQTVLHPVSDLAAAKAVYTALLGVPPQVDEVYYVGYQVAGQQIGLVPGGASQGMTAPVAYWHVADITAKLAEVTAAGAIVKEPVH